MQAPASRLATLIEGLVRALRTAAPPPRALPYLGLEHASGTGFHLLDALVEGYRVPAVRVRILAKRPADSSGELHGLYEPEEGRTPARITAWMRTAQRQQVVAFKTFLRTLIHELCHHLDYELYALEETFHTEGFYKRESSLVAALLAQREAATDAARQA